VRACACVCVCERERERERERELGEQLKGQQERHICKTLMISRL